MLDRTFSSLADFAGAVGRGFMLPGDLLLSAFAWIAPQTTQILTFGNGKTIVTFVLALFGWTMMVVAGLLISRLCRGIAWQVAALFRVLVWRTKQFLGSLKTKMLWKYREFFPHKRTEGSSVSQEQFDDLDIAVLASVSRGRTGKASTASELAQKYKVQPAQIQQRLERLTENHMLSSVKSSILGRNKKYRLTDSGLALIAMCERQAAQRVSLTSASVSG
jgi:DNA-binding MarR family transcriptional regulator